MMSQTIASCNVNISSANIRTTKDRKAICLFDIEVTNVSVPTPKPAQPVMPGGIPHGGGQPQGH